MAGRYYEEFPCRDRCFSRALWAVAVAVTTCVNPAVAQEESKRPTIATSSDLSSAFPPGEWARVERSVDLGLAWLASQQAADGRFPSKPAAQPAVTSLAVMAFLSRGHVPDHGRYGRRISKAIDFVLSTQRRRGFFSLLSVSGPRRHLGPSQTAIYNHAISGLMLGEVYGMTTGLRSRRIKTAMEKALLYSREVQTRKKSNPDDVGGWRYSSSVGPNATSDMSVTGWQLMFLRSARNAEFDVPKQYVDEGLDFVERCFEPEADKRVKGAFRYRPSPAKEAHVSLANTGSAMLVLMLGGRHKAKSVRAGIEWYRSRKYPRPGRAPHYYLSAYYSSQAMAQVGGDAWNEVYPQIARTLLQEQTTGGSWPLGPGGEKHFGSTYTTSMAVLALTPPYQLLPIFQR